TNIPVERETAYDAVFDVEGRPPRNPNDVPITSHRIVSPGYLETLGVTLIKGRLIDKSDRAESLPVVVVSQEFARQAWPGDDAIHGIDPDQPVSNIMTMSTNLSTVLVTERFGAVLMGTLAGCGLLLASIGLYGVVAYSVRQRTGEIGIRIALGAQPKHVLRLIMGYGMKLTILGVSIGLVAAWAATRLLASLLFGLSA